MKVDGFSPGSGRFLGWKEKELKGKGWATVLKPKDGSGRLLDEMDFVGQGPLVNGEMSKGQKVSIVTGNDRKVFCHIRALPLRSKGKEPSQLLFVFKKAAIPKKTRKDA